MNIMKDKVAAIRSSDYFPLYIVLFMQLFLHLTVVTPFNIGDDAQAVHFLDGIGLWDWSVTFFNTWSSRVLVNGAIAVIARFSPIVWKLLDVGMIFLLLYAISNLFIVRNKRVLNKALACMFLLYPFAQLTSAGWLCTTVSYLWPVALGLYSCTLLRRVSIGKPTRWYHYALCGLASVFATNAEQMSAIFFVVFLAVLIYLVRTKGKGIPAAAMLFTITVVSLCVHLLCPGNGLRKIEAIRGCDIDFEMLSLVEKLQLGFSETMSKFFFSPNLIFAAVTGLILFVIFKKYKTFWCRAIGTIPFGVCLCVGFGTNILLPIFPELKTFASFGAFDYFNYPGTAYGGLVTAQNFQSLSAYVPLLVMVFCMCLVAAGIYLSIENNALALLTCLLLFCGIGSGMIMGFSPTLYASILRPFVNSYFCFIVVFVIILHENYYIASEKEKKCGSLLLAVPAVLNSFVIVMQALRLFDAYGAL